MVVKQVHWYVVAMLALASCGSGAQEAPDAPDIEPVDTIAPAPDGVTASEIPQAMRGRWGLSDEDCDAARPASTGLLEIDAHNLQFYESYAILDEIAEASDDMLRARFDFSGEGMEWEREMRLQLEADGQTLVRSDLGNDAPAEPVEYTRCS